MKKQAYVCALVALALSCVCFLAGSIGPDGPVRSVLLWESTVLDAPSHARHPVIIVGVENVTGDDAPDIVAVVAEHVNIYAGDGDGGFALHESIALTDRVQMAANPLPFFNPSYGIVEDLDGDGVREVLVGGALSEPDSDRRSMILVLKRSEAGYVLCAEYPCSGPPQRMGLWQTEVGETHLWLANSVETGEQIERLVLAGMEVIDRRILMDLDEWWYASAFSDLNSDGNPDLLQTHVKNGLQIALGRADGELQAPVLITDLSGLSGVVVGDLNRDGRTEVVGYGPIGLAVIEQPWDLGQAQTTVYDVGYPVREANLEDVNGDHVLDIVAVADSGQRILVLPGDGEGFGAMQVFIPGYPVDWAGDPLLIADLDRDHAPDLVVGTLYSLRVLMNGGSEPWGTSQIPFGGDKLLAVGDVDQDGDVDIVTQGVAGLDVLVNEEGVLRRSPDFFGLDGMRCTAARVTDDRVYALATRYTMSGQPYSQTLSVFDMNRNLMAEHRLGSAVLPVFAAGDLDGDGEEDVFGTEDGQLWVAWSGTLLSQYELDGDPSLVAAVDRSDGGQDAAVVVTDEYADVVRMSFQDRQAVTSAPALRLLSVPFSMTSTDWDGDGKLDVFLMAMKYTAEPEEGGTAVSVGPDGVEWGYVTAAGEGAILLLDEFPEGETLTPFVAPVLGRLDNDGVHRLAFTTTAGSQIYVHSLRDGVPGLVERIEKGIGPLLAADLDGNGVDELIGSTLGMFPVVWICWNGGGR